MAVFDAYEAHDAVGLAERVRAGEVHPSELVEAAIARIEARDGALNAVVHRMFQEARARAAGPLPDGPLAGVPFLLKDLHATVPGHPTSAGTRLLAMVRRAHATTLVQRYQDAGLILLGKTNVPELAIMGITESRLHGPARNPWDPSRTPGGSSGGSGAAVAAGYVPAAHASDGGGSIRIPASHNGLVGLKPSRGRMPTGPRHGESWLGLAVEHVVTRSVRDTAALLDVTCAPEPGAPYVAPPPERPYLDEVGASPGRLRIAVTPTALLAGENDPSCVAAVQEAAHLAEELGHHVEEATPALPAAALRQAYFAHVAAGVAMELDEILELTGKVVRAADVEPTTWLFGRIGRALTAVDLAHARRDAQRAGFVLADFFERYDVWLTATCARPPAPVGELYPDAQKERLIQVLRVAGTRRVLLAALERLAEDALAATPNTQIANLAGLPAISLPTHWTPGGLPVGTQWTAPLGREDRLLRLAAQIEAARPSFHHRPPVADLP